MGTLGSEEVEIWTTDRVTEKLSGFSGCSRCQNFAGWGGEVAGSAQWFRKTLFFAWMAKDLRPVGQRMSELIARLA
ncbi:hypothetical protein CEE69_17295 [Rhodopirellula bahusiensis]|uniref:Uncharacterized protein n=1 Tax=Rhodopirellula bahusiensis TaxID=2014065 RepID=A0A2G1W4Y2_9BACT|nr:hypothetical protein CEE69_17295 [Rhodopirellula bahusiensis]